METITEKAMQDADALKITLEITRTDGLFTVSMNDDESGLSMISGHDVDNLSVAEILRCLYDKSYGVENPRFDATQECGKENNMGLLNALLGKNKPQIKGRRLPRIRVIRRWDVQAVRQVCIDNDLYTCGSNEQYENLLSWIPHSEPTPYQLYAFAENICKHSEDQTITNIMYLLEKYAVITTFELYDE